MSYKNLTFNSKKKRGFEAHLFSTYFRVQNKCRGRNINELAYVNKKELWDGVLSLLEEKRIGRIFSIT